MNTSKLTIAALTRPVAVGMVSDVFANPQRIRPAGKDKYAFITGSRIAQEVKVKSSGTATALPVRVCERREINQMGRFTTEGVLAQDPSVRVISGGLPGNH